MGSLVDVKWLKTIAMFGLLGLWLGATNHCKLEEIPGLSFLVCCDHEGATPHEDNDCATDACAQVENSFYKTQNSKVAAVKPALVLALCVMSGIEVEAKPQPALSDFLTVAPPEFSVTWQFSFRTALPPRAPSITS